eukprot:5809557-Alexandrium_andersonii.AAC.1
MGHDPDGCIAALHASGEGLEEAQMQAQAQQTTMDPPAVPHSSACADGGSSIDVASSSSVAPRA